MFACPSTSELLFYGCCHPCYTSDYATRDLGELEEMGRGWSGLFNYKKNKEKQGWQHP